MSGIALLLVVAITAVGMVIYRAEPTLRAQVIETLSTRFKSKVELDAFHVSLVKGLQTLTDGDRLEVDSAQTGEPPFQQEWRWN